MKIRSAKFELIQKSVVNTLNVARELETAGSLPLSRPSKLLYVFFK